MTAADATLVYNQSPRPVGYPVSYALRPGMLVVDSGRKVFDIRLGAVEEVRLSFEPGRLGQRTFVTKLRVKDGRTVTYSSVTWKGILEAHQQGPQYRAFTAALIREVAEQSPGARFVAGKRLVPWLLTVALAGLMLVGLAYGVWRSLDRAAPGAAALIAMVGLIGVWQLEPLVRLNKPRGFAPDAPPPELMP